MCSIEACGGRRTGLAFIRILLLMFGFFTSSLNIIYPQVNSVRVFLPKEVFLKNKLTTADLGEHGPKWEDKCSGLTVKTLMQADFWCGLQGKECLP